MTPEEWLATAIAAFNYPEEMGERPEDALVELVALSAAPPAGVTPLQREQLAVLKAEAGAAVEGAYGDGGTPYATARLEEGRLELYHGTRGQWIPSDQREARRAHTQPPPPSDGHARWGGFDKRGPDIEARFQDHDPVDKRLIDVARQLFEEGDELLAEEIATTVLREGATWPGRWWSLLGEVRLARGDLPGAREAIARALLYVVTYDPKAFALMVRWLEASGADEETVAVAFHAVTAWSYHLGKREHLGGRRLPKPKQLKSRFGVIYAEWIREVWPGLDAFSPDQILHLRGLFADLAGRPLADLRKEVDARIAVILAKP